MATYNSKLITSAVVVTLESLETMSETNIPDTLYQSYDILIDVLRGVLIPWREDVRYQTDLQNAIGHYEQLYNKEVSQLQSLLVREPHQIPISRVLIVFATQLQEKLNEKEPDRLKRDATIEYITSGLMKRCSNLEEELMAMDKEINETGKVEVFTI